MATTIPDLWSDDIKVDVLTPLAILRTQAGLLGRKTQGLLGAEVTTATGDKSVQHQLDLIAPALDYRHRLLTAQHKRDLVYPVVVEAECFEPKLKAASGGLVQAIVSFGEDWRPKAETEQAFIELVGKVLRSGEVRSLIQSLIARSNEQRNASVAPPSQEDEDAQG